MRKLFLGLALSLVATAASAEWVLVTTNPAGDHMYSDLTTTKRNGNVVRIWEIIDSGKPQVAGDKTYQSDRSYWQIDCEERTRQRLQATLFAGKMATGETLFSFDKPNDKRFVAPGTAAEDLLDFACK